MKKLISSVLLAAGAFAMAGSALADADCQAGSAWGAKEGCGGPTQSGVPQPTPAPNVYNNSGYTPPQANYGYPYAYGNRPYGAVVPQYPYERRIDRRQLNPTRGDRDGDGVANRQDRYPNDPSRW